jgi:ligand-binding SRPBCC domain-containing protein
MITFETDVHIERPLEEVFAYVSEPLNFPRWNSAVEVVHETSVREGGTGSTYVMERELPTGRAVNRLDVVTSEAPREFTVRASAGPTPFLYRYRFSSQNGETVVNLDAEVELPGAAALVPPLARRAIKRGVDDNLATLKRVLELGDRSSPSRGHSRLA